MTDPTGSALMARIKELEEALGRIIKMYLHNAYEKDYEAELDDAISDADKALNK